MKNIEKLISTKLNQQIKIDNLVYFKKEKQLDIFFTAENIADNNHLKDLEAQIIKSFGDITKLSLKPKYELPHISQTEAIHLYNENIKFIVCSICPSAVCLKNKINIIYHTDKNQISIEIPDDMICNRLISLNAVRSIKNTVLEHLGYDMEIVISNTAIELDINKYNKDKEQNTLDIISELPENNSESKKSNDIKAKSKTGKDSPYKKEYIVKESEQTPVDISDLKGNEYSISIVGEVFAADSRLLRNGKTLLTFAVTDHKGSVYCKQFLKENENPVKIGDNLKITGDVAYDGYIREIVLNVKKISSVPKKIRKDLSVSKRVELHAHTTMSSMDALSKPSELIKKAKEFGHKAIAITDHGVVQAFPEAMEAGKKHGIKIIYGVEAYIADDTVKITDEDINAGFDDEFVVFDIETTGFSNTMDRITEIGAVRIKNNEITETFSALVNPMIPIPQKIQELTGITPDMVKDQPVIDEVMVKFLDFISDNILVAHNSDFDMGFIRSNCIRLGIEFKNKAIDTLLLSRVLLKDIKRHKLDSVAKHLGVTIKNHHRAVDDAQATAEIFLKLIALVKEDGIETFDQLNNMKGKVSYKSVNTNHAVILASNYTGLKNLYKLISYSHLDHFYKNPRILKSLIKTHRDGLIIGSACEAGEVYQALMKKKTDKEIDSIAGFYDYIEIMPSENNSFMVRNKTVESEKDLRKINMKLLDIAKRNRKLAVATGDVHFINPEDEIYRKVLKHSIGFKDSDQDSSLYFKTTDEMLEEFSYLGEDTAYEVVVKNTNAISDMIEDIIPIPEGTYPPVIDGSDIELREMCYKKARSIYGDELPEIVEKRLARELNSIISNGYAVMYIIAQKLVTKSIEDGYLVGSRGSVGSSLAATMSDITEVNPLPPHYICKSCRYSEFILDSSVFNGQDLPDKKCRCGEDLSKDGHDIPFEVFLGFEGDKEPDIDLNFAGEYQANSHRYTEELFGKGYVFRAGTIGTIAEKTAFGFARKYAEENNLEANGAEIERLKMGCTGIKRTSGQHPGGVMIVPSYKEIYDFTPIQYPANDSTSGVITTHFDYHSISGRILKLDILGHDVPSIIKMLEDFTSTNATAIPLDDQSTMSIFTSTDKLNCSLEELSCTVGSLGIPEFGTKFVRQMLVDTHPTTFAELLRISGLSHGTDVWLNNAQDLVRNNVATLNDVISTRDDIMNYLIFMGLESKMSFKIMENVRKGKGLTEDHIEAMKEKNVPSWYIDSCQKIKYMFPKAHAAAYVMMSFRIAYYKVHHKEAFYATYFTTKAEDFDIALISQGSEAILEKIKEIEALGNEATAKEKNISTVLEVAFEMYKRGVKLEKIDLYRSHSHRFLITETNSILPPLISMQGLGETVAINISQQSGKEFISIEDFRQRTKATKTVIESLIKHGCLSSLPQTNQLSLL